MVMPTPVPTMHLRALCYTCRPKVFHDIETPVSALVPRLADWHEKHPGHDIEFISRHRTIPRNLDESLFQERNVTPWWLEWRENVDFKLAYASSASYTITLTALASDSTLLAGRAGTAISNTSNLYLDYLIGGNVIVNGVSAPTSQTVIEVWAYGSQNDTPTYADGITGTDANKSMTSAAIKSSGLAPLANLYVDGTTTGRSYPFYPVSGAAVFGRVPKNHGIFVVQNTGQALHASAAGGIQYTGVYMTG